MMMEAEDQEMNNVSPEECIEACKKSVVELIEASRTDKSVCLYCLEDITDTKALEGRKPIVILGGSEEQADIKSRNFIEQFAFHPGQCEAYAICYLGDEEKLKKHVYYAAIFRVNQEKNEFNKIANDYSKQHALPCHGASEFEVGGGGGQQSSSRKRGRGEAERYTPHFAIPHGEGGEAPSLSTIIIAAQECIRKDLAGELESPVEKESGRGRKREKCDDGEE